MLGQERYGPGIAFRECNHVRTFIAFHDSPGRAANPMIRPLLFFVLMAACVPGAHAQWRAQLYAGVAGSSLRGNIETERSPIYRLTGGAGMQYQSPTGLIFEPTARYTMKGAVLDGTIDGIPVNAVEEIAYLEFPALIGYRWHGRGGFQPKVLLGPVYSIRLDANITVRPASGGTEQTEPDTTIRGTDWGLAMILAGEQTVGSETLSVGLSGTAGLTNVRTVDPPLRNVSIGLFVGIVF